jgi:hypothetical protein
MRPFLHMGLGCSPCQSWPIQSSPSPITKNRYRSKSHVSYLLHCHRISNI